MSKDMDNGIGKTIQDCVCDVKIADDVVSNIAGIAATEVEGVAGLIGNITNEMISRVGKRTLAKGVNVSLQDSAVSVKLALIMKYGYNIPVTSKKVQERVKNSIESMTGLDVKEVAIRIAGIDTTGQE